MDQAKISAEQRLRRERLQPKLTEVDFALIHAMEEAQADPQATLVATADALKKSTRIDLKLTRAQYKELAPHLLRYTETCREYLAIKGQPQGFVDLCERIDAWRKKLEGISEEMEKFGFAEERELMENLSFALWKKSSPERRQGSWRLIPGNEMEKAKGLKGVVKLWQRYRGTREKSSEDHFVRNFAVPAMTTLGNQRNRFFYLAEIYLHFYPEQRNPHLSGKVALEKIAGLLTDRVKNHKKKYGSAKGR